MMKCPICNAENEPDARTCARCGFSLELTTPTWPDSVTSEPVQVEWPSLDQIEPPVIEPLPTPPSTADTPAGLKEPGPPEPSPPTPVQPPEEKPTPSNPAEVPPDVRAELPPWLKEIAPPKKPAPPQAAPPFLRSFLPTPPLLGKIIPIALFSGIVSIVGGGWAVIAAAGLGAIAGNIVAGTARETRTALGVGEAIKSGFLVGLGGWIGRGIWFIGWAASHLYASPTAFLDNMMGVLFSFLLIPVAVGTSIFGQQKSR